MFSDVEVVATFLEVASLFQDHGNDVTVENVADRDADAKEEETGDGRDTVDLVNEIRIRGVAR